MKNSPKGWRTALLDNLARRGSGHTPNRKIQKYWNGGIKWVSLADSDKLDRVMITATEHEISEDGIANSSAVKHSAGSVLVSRDAGVGKSAVMADEMAVSQHFIAWHCGPELHNFYFYYWLQKAKPLFERIAFGSTIKTIGLSFFEKLEIPLPPFPEQKIIAEVLLFWDGAIHKQEVLLVAKVQRKRGLMQQLLTGKTRFKEFKGEPWRSVRIGSLLKECDRYVGWSDDEGYQFASIRRRSGGLFDRGTFQGREVKTKVLKLLEAGDFVISKRQVVHGAWAVVTKQFQGFGVSDEYDVLVNRDPKVLDIRFFNYLSQTRRLWHMAYLASNGVHIEKLIFNFDDFAKERVKIPPTVREQAKIVEVLAACDSEIDLLQKQLEALKEQKRGLMQKLLTGEIRVKT
jgi:type I restriction enzyme S subunit